MPREGGISRELFTHCTTGQEQSVCVTCRTATSTVVFCNLESRNCTRCNAVPWSAPSANTSRARSVPALFRRRRPSRCWFVFLHGARTVCAGCSLAERPAERGRDPSQHVPRGSSSDRQRKDAQSRSDNHVGVRARMDRSARMDRACTSLTNEPTSVCHVGCHRGDGRGGATTSPQQLRPAPSRWQSTAAWHRSSQPHQAGGSRHVLALAS